MTVGISTSVALAAPFLHRGGAKPFTRVLQATLIEASLLYLLGVYVVWSISDGIGGIATFLLFAGVAAAVVPVALPLAIGRTLVRRTRDVDSETALRYTMDGRPVAMLVVFGIAFAPGGLGHGHIFGFGGPRICLGGFCGISIFSVAGAFSAAVVTLFGPSIVGLALAFSRGRATEDPHSD